MWPGVCQSCVSTTFWKPLAILLMSGHDLVAALDGEAAAGREAVLHVDDDEGRIGPRLDLALRERARDQQGASERPPAAAENRAAR